MNSVNMKYNLCSLEEPTEEQLQQIMREACEEARTKAAKAAELFQQDLEKAIQEAESYYNKKYARA